MRKIIESTLVGDLECADPHACEEAQLLGVETNRVTLSSSKGEPRSWPMLRQAQHDSEYMTVGTLSAAIRSRAKGRSARRRDQPPQPGLVEASAKNGAHASPLPA